jgi:hypothetical protein
MRLFLQEDWYILVQAYAIFEKQDLKQLNCVQIDLMKTLKHSFVDLYTKVDCRCDCSNRLSKTKEKLEVSGQSETEFQ